MKTAHVPVLLDAILDRIPRKKLLICDATFGNGGYTRKLLEMCDCRVIATDRDPMAITRAQEMSFKFPNRLFIQKCSFDNLNSIIPLIQSLGRSHLDGILFDIGVSTNQLSMASRGFSFRVDGPLDMRMDPQTRLTAHEIVNEYSEKKLADLFYKYEVLKSKKIAKDICSARNKQKINSTLELAQIISSSLGKPQEWMHGRNHPAVTAFQALRIHVNNELEQLEAALRFSERILEPNGFCGVVSFHSLEDRIVKRFFNRAAMGLSSSSQDFAKISGKRKRQRTDDSWQEPINTDMPSFIVSKKPIAPSKAEIESNPRSRSAKLRWATRTSYPPLHSD